MTVGLSGIDEAKYQLPSASSPMMTTSVKSAANAASNTLSVGIGNLVITSKVTTSDIDILILLT